LTGRQVEVGYKFGSGQGEKLRHARRYVLNQDWWMLRRYLLRMLADLSAEREKRKGKASAGTVAASILYGLRDRRQLSQDRVAIMMKHGLALEEAQRAARSAITDDALQSLLILSIAEGGGKAA
jgi:hypothetical protein